MQIVGIDYKNKKQIGLSIEKDRIADIQYADVIADDPLPYVAPGLVDLQVNGFKGVDFNSTTITPAAISDLVRSLLQEGVTSFLPTIITNSGQNISHALHNITIACEKYHEVNRSVPGIHLEGPFISKQDGPRGAHPAEYVRAPDWELFCRWQDIAQGKIRLITLSPEWPEARGFIKNCVRSGVRVAIGHTAATAAQIQEASAAGATLSTHLGNATHLHLHRHKNYIWEQLANDKLWASLIADGHHLPDAVLKVFLKMKKNKSFLVSDATRFAGLAPGAYQTHIGGEVVLDHQGRLSVRDQPEFLAGAALSLLACVNCVLSKGLLSLSEAWDAASLLPLQFLDHKKRSAFTKGAPADLVLFSMEKGRVRVLQTIKAGKPVHPLNTSL